MKKNRIFGALSAAALLFAGACSNDMLDQNKNQGLLNTDDTSGGVYLAVDFKMPTGAGTRSETLDPDAEDNPNHYNSDAGTEVGLDAENYVSSALIVLAASESNPAGIDKYGFLVAGEVPSNRIATGNATEGRKIYRATAKLQKANLNRLYQIYGVTGEGTTPEEGEEENPTPAPTQQLPEVYVFVFANPTTELVNMFSEGNTAFGSADWVNATCEVLQTTDATQSKNVGIWGTNSFLMNNVHLTKRELPKYLLDWENFSTVERPFHLSGNNTAENMTSVDNSDLANRGAVLVERSVARFDFKDGSTIGDNKYHVLMNTKEDGDFDDAKPIVDVQIQKMCLVNMCNKFYYLPRVSPNGLYEEGTPVTLCGVEMPWVRDANGAYSGGNYVVGPYAPVFGGEDPLKTGFSQYMNFAFFDNDGSFNNNVMSSSARWDVVKVKDVLKGTPDNYVNPNVAGSTAGQYRIWRYVTENVIPVNSGKQVNGISTGVVFKGKLLGSALATSADAGFYEAEWNKGNIANLAKCLNGETFTYNGENHVLVGNSQDDPILYYYQGQLYMGWRHIRQAAIQDAVTISTAGAVEINRSSSLYQAVFGEGGPIPTYVEDGVEKHMVYINKDGDKITIDDPLWIAAQNNHASAEWEAYIESANYAWTEWSLNGKEIITEDEEGEHASDKLVAMRKAVTDAGITIFQSSKDDDEGAGAGYYCYYYYWNRHNDNHLNGSMGPMEFDVVRNNVYKLSIDKIARLGHPRIPENDPNDPTPDTPDESDEIYLDVRMEIVPWVVRLNSIQF